jgi:hypothetical protein
MGEELAYNEMLRRAIDALIVDLGIYWEEGKHSWFSKIKVWKYYVISWRSG